MRHHGHFGSRAGISGDRFYLYYAVVNFRHFLSKKLGHELRMGAGKKYLGSPRFFTNIDNIGPHPITVRIMLSRDGFIAPQQRLGAAEIDDNIAKFHTLYQAVDDIADTFLVFLELTLAFGVPDLLYDHLLGRLSGNAAKIYRRQGIYYEFSDFYFRVGLLRRIKCGLGDFVLHLVRHLDISGENNLTAFAIDGGPDIVLMTVFGGPGLLYCLFHRFQNFVLFNTLVTGDSFGHLQQLGSRVNGIRFNISIGHLLRCSSDGSRAYPRL